MPKLEIHYIIMLKVWVSKAMDWERGLKRSLLIVTHVTVYKNVSHFLGDLKTRKSTVGEPLRALFSVHITHTSCPTLYKPDNKRLDSSYEAGKVLTLGVK